MSTPSDPTPGAPQPEDSGFGTAQYGQPASSPAGDDTTAAGGEFAGFWIRFAGAVIDGVLLAIVAAILGALLGIEGFQSRQGVSSLLGAVYFTYFHGTTGQSLGQKILNIKVVDEDGRGQIDYVRAFIRWLVSIVSGIVIALGYLWMLWDPKNQTWHDKAARSLVVKV